MPCTQTGIPWESQHYMTKPCGSGDTVDGAVVQREYMFLPGEICSRSGQWLPREPD